MHPQSAELSARSPASVPQTASPPSLPHGWHSPRGSWRWSRVHLPTCDTEDWSRPLTRWTLTSSVTFASETIRGHKFGQHDSRMEGESRALFVTWHWWEQQTTWCRGGKVGTANKTCYESVEGFELVAYDCMRTQWEWDENTTRMQRKVKESMWVENVPQCTRLLLAQWLGWHANRTLCHCIYCWLTSLLVLLLPECTRADHTQCFPRYCQAQMQGRAQQREAGKETLTQNVTWR